MNEDKVFSCPICGLHYKDREIARQCEAFCSTNQACSMEIAKHAIEHSQARREAVDES